MCRLPNGRAGGGLGKGAHRRWQRVGGPPPLRGTPPQRDRSGPRRSSTPSLGSGVKGPPGLAIQKRQETGEGTITTMHCKLGRRVGAWGPPRDARGQWQLGSCLQAPLCARKGLQGCGALQGRHGPGSAVLCGRYSTLRTKVHWQLRLKSCMEIQGQGPWARPSTGTPTWETWRGTGRGGGAGLEPADRPSVSSV